MFHLEMDVLCSELTPSLIVTEYRINVTDLDYIELGKRLEPTKNVVAINSNFTHKALDGYDQFISKPKVKRTKKMIALRRLLLGEAERVQVIILPLMLVLSLLLLLIMRRILKLPDTFLDLALYKYLVLIFLLIFS